jgi:hypothetical protein
MPRKPIVLSRARGRLGPRNTRTTPAALRLAGPKRPPSSGASRNRGGSASSTVGGRRFHQCLACGAPVDPMYGTGEGSWCPHCHQPGEIFWSEGRLPDPQLYGTWLLEQQKGAVGATPASPTNPSFPSINAPITTSGESEMKLRKAHTGVYSCPKCCVEYDLNNETVLKCEDCGGPLLEGTLEDILDEDDAEQD